MIESSTTELTVHLEQRLRRLEDERDIRKMLTGMVSLVDRRAWADVVGLFTPTVQADWSALSGVPAAEVTAAELVAGWRSGLGGLTATHHLLGNEDISIDGDRAAASAHVHAAHRLATPYADDLWVVAGSYTWQLVRTEAGWRIAAARFQPIWGRGNQQVLAAAAERAS